MKTSLICLFVSASLFLAVSSVNAQDYQTAAGLRLGYPTSVTIKHFISESNALEAYVGSRGYYSWLRWYNLSAAYLHHSPLEILDVDGLLWYVGGGASLYFWSYDLGYYSGNYGATSLGLQGYLGLEYGLSDLGLPVTVTLDWVPSIFLGQYNYGINRLGAGQGGLGIRYHLR